MKYIQGLIFATILALSSNIAAGEEDNNTSLRRRKRNLTTNNKKFNRKRRNHIKNHNKNNDVDVMDETDIDYWQRLLQRNGSMPQTQRPTPRVTNPPIAIITPNPTPSPVTPSPTVTKVTPSPVNSCGLTPTERREQIEENLSPVSSALSNQIPTPQRLALNWIINDDGAQLCPDDDSLVQRYTLAVFYYSTNGDDWKECNAPSNFDSQASIAVANSACTLTTVNATTIFPNDVRGTNAWLTPESECTWGGISCYATNTPNAMKVNVVEFENNGLSGVLPTEMEQLTKMRFFALERGSIGGAIPSSYGNLKSLLLLDFDFNQLTGTIPSSLWSLTALRQLDLNDNRLRGTLSEDIGKLSQLRFFQIDNNRMQGQIPSALGDIPNFSLIGLSGNNFQGAMPEKVCDLRPDPLQTLVVDCSIDCEIPQCCTSCVPAITLNKLMFGGFGP